MLEGKTPPETIYRIGRKPDPWQPPDWSRANPDGTFGNRFDDPEGYYRVLYAASRPTKYLKASAAGMATLRTSPSAVQPASQC